VADAPVAGHVHNMDVVSSANGQPATPAPQHPTSDEITTLVKSATAANVSLEDFGTDMRRLMQLPDGQKITKKFLRETMTMDQYNTARKVYGDRLEAILKEDVPNHERPSQNVDADTPATPQPSPEGTTGPFASSSAPEGGAATRTPDPAEAGHLDAEAREKLRQEAISWGVNPGEVGYILAHHADLTKCRTILWKARRNEPPPQWAPIPAAAAD
jgi:hypothetical protein